MTTSNWRRAHGNAAKNGTALVVLENGRDRPLPPASPAEPAGKDREPNGHFAKGNGIGCKAKSRAAHDGKLPKVDANADPEARASQQWARRRASRRKAELERMHGGAISGEVSALVDDSWEMRGDARYWAAQGRGKRDATLTRLADDLLTSARQAMRDAWELASREAAARPRAQNQTQQRLASQRASAALPLTRQPLSTVAAPDAAPTDQSASASQPDAFPTPETRTTDD